MNDPPVCLICELTGIVRAAFLQAARNRLAVERLAGDMPDDFAQSVTELRDIAIRLSYDLETLNAHHHTGRAAKGEPT